MSNVHNEQSGVIVNPNRAPNEKQQANEGEGNKTAARRYNAAQEKYAKSGRSDEAAREAKAAIEGEEGQELREAEEEGRSRATDVERESDEAGLDAEREAPSPHDRKNVDED